MLAFVKSITALCLQIYDLGIARADDRPALLQSAPGLLCSGTVTAQIGAVRGLHLDLRKRPGQVA